jgi:hypothetical protein
MIIPNLKAWAIAIPSAMLIALVTWYVWDAERSKDRLALAVAQLSAAQLAASTNSRAAQDCLAINAANAAEAVRQKTIADAALARLATQSTNADSEADRARHDAENLRASGLDCPAIDSSFRKWLRRDS